MRIATYTGIALAFFLAGCNPWKSQIQDRAAHDFQCNAGAVKVEQVQGLPGSAGTFAAKGCVSSPLT